MKKILLLLAVLVGISVAASARAQPKPDEGGWESVDGSMMQKGESIPASRLVAGAYGFIFAAIVVYVASIAARSRRVEDELDQLRRKLEEKR